MKVSIVTLSYNQRSFLQEAIDSVLQQDHTDLEYIVVDPGSTDGSRELIESYGEKISQVIFESDKGAPDGLNKGFARATGDIFGFLNSDDFLLPGALRKVAEFFESHPECSVAMGSGFIVDGSGRNLRHVTARNFTVRRYLYGGARFLQQCTFFRREAFELLTGFNTENQTCWDGELFVSMVQKGAVVGYVDADLASFRIHNASISGSLRLADAYFADCRRIFRQMWGREWRFTDEMLRVFYRCEGLLLRSRFWPRAETRKRNTA